MNPWYLHFQERRMESVICVVLLTNWHEICTKPHNIRSQCTATRWRECDFTSSGQRDFHIRLLPRMRNTMPDEWRVNKAPATSRYAYGFRRPLAQLGLVYIVCVISLQYWWFWCWVLYIAVLFWIHDWWGPIIHVGCALRVYSGGSWDSLENNHVA